MNIVIDSNILFSALIKEGYTRKLILEYESKFLFPEFIFKEFVKHEEELLKKTCLSKDEFYSLINVLLSKVIIVPEVLLNKYKCEAKRIVEKIDSDDAMFFACALAFENCIIWSDDKQLKKQEEVRVISSNNIMPFLK